MELNNTKNAKKDILFFNRVPKVGSQTTMELLKSLSIKNKFHYHKDRTQKVETIKLSQSEEVSGSCIYTIKCSIFVIFSEMVVQLARFL